MMILSCVLISMGVGLLVGDSVVKHFFDEGVVITVIVAGVIVFFLSLLGFGGGASGKYKYVLPYIILVRYKPHARPMKLLCSAGSSHCC